MTPPEDLKIIALSNCPLDPVLGSGRTRLAWSTGLRSLGHEVRVVDTLELLAGATERQSGRRLRIGWQGWRWLQEHGLEDVDLIEFYGSEFWSATWRLSARTGRRPFIVAHTDGLELLAAERLAATAATPAALSAPRWRAAAAALMRGAEKLAFSRCDGFVTGCELDRRYLREHGIGPADRMEVIPLGLEPPFLGLPVANPREERVAFLGSWIARKGTAHLVAAMVPLLEQRPNLNLDLLGVGTDPAEVRAAFPPSLHRRLNIVARLSIPEVIAGLSRAKVYFFPSEYEGFGLGLAEAMACGCAAVTTPTGFGAELAAGEEALLCEFGAVPAMQAAVAHLLDDTLFCERIARSGWQRAQTLRWETSVQQLEQTYRRWTAAPAPNP